MVYFWIKKLCFTVFKLLAIVLLLTGTFGFFLYQNLSELPNENEYADHRPDRFSIDPETWPNINASQYFVSTYDVVRFPSLDPELSMEGWYLHDDQHTQVVIIIPGFKSAKGSEKSLVSAAMLFRNGFNVLLLDTRDQGGSDREDLRTALGTEEYRDVLGGWTWLQDSKGYQADQIGIMGGSLGAVTALITFLKEERIQAVFLDSPFSDHERVIKEELRRKGYPQWLAYSGILWAKLLAQDDLLSVPMLDLIYTSRKRPVFLMHARGDDRISFYHSEDLEQAFRAADFPLQTWWVDEDHHVKTMFSSPKQYEDALTSFFRLYLQ